MKLPRNLFGSELANGLERNGYSRTRQKGAHLNMTTQRGGEHHVTVPLHKPLKVGTLNAILSSVAEHLEMERNALMDAMKL